MEHTLPAPPCGVAFAPLMSHETFEYHCGKHHLAHVIKLNKLNKGTEFERASLETIIKNAPAGDIYNAAAQVWNHTFFWRSMEPNGGGTPSGALADAINEKWGDFDKFKEVFQTSALANYDSGWTWLVKKADGSLDIDNIGAAGTPLRTAVKPLLCVDVKEQAYYIEYRNKRLKFFEAFLNRMANWDFAARNFA